MPIRVKIWQLAHQHGEHQSFLGMKCPHWKRASNRFNKRTVYLKGTRDWIEDF